MQPEPPELILQWILDQESLLEIAYLHLGFEIIISLHCNYAYFYFDFFNSFIIDARNAYFYVGLLFFQLGIHPTLRQSL